VTASPVMGSDVWNEEVAQHYDRSVADMYAPEVLGPTVDFLARRAGEGPALEFAIGNGRVALPLRSRGVPVSGIELSGAMVRQLRAKPGGDRLDVVMGSMATTRVAGVFSLVYLVFNTITNLLGQDEQVECFRNAARHLGAGGRFVVEVGVPDLRRLPPGEYARLFQIDAEHVGFDTFDLVDQRLVSHHYWLSEGAARTFHSSHRYAWPAELDLMARLAGLTLQERWADWTEAPFTAESTSHVSVWAKPIG
jgi:SAM-dependent methyltransferase